MDSFHKKALIVVALVVAYLLLVIVWVGATMYAQKYIDEKLLAIEQQYRVSIQYETLKLKGLNRVEINNIAVFPLQSDTLFTAASVKAKINLLKLLLFQPEISNLEVNQLNLHLSNNIAGVSFAEDDYAKRADQLLDVLFDLLPRQLALQNVQVSYLYEGIESIWEIKELSVHDSHFKAEVKTVENKSENEWICQGSLLADERKVDLRMYAKPHSHIELPFVAYKYDSYIQFDTLAFEMQSVRKESGEITLQGKAGVKGLKVLDERIATEMVSLNLGYANYIVHVGKNFVELDKRTTVICNKLKLNPYLKAEKKNDWHITASIDKENFPAAELFESIPQGLFYHVEGLQAEGTLTYHFFLDVDMADVENLKFRSTLDSRHFRILQFGNTDLDMMNTPFRHTVYEQDTPVRVFELGRNNPAYRSLQQISRYLPYAIMHAEDSEFYAHQGFLQDAFRRSLVQNIQERRFARGGSTLSMQVVKNVFLSRNKTIARKLEEIMIVWLIETCKLTSKQRMFEVYMNVIEWGPDVYGVTEASRFYFNKEPSALTLTECIFLAYILPEPKNVKSHFNGLQIQSAFRPFYYDAVKRIYQRHWITERERAMSTPYLRITGPAVEYLSR